MVRPIRTTLVALAAAAAVTAFAIPVGAHSARPQTRAAATAITSVDVTLTNFTPAAPLAGQTLTIGGSFTTIAASGTGGLSARLRILSPVTARSELPTALDASTAGTARTVRTQVIAPGTNLGDVVPFSLSVPVNSLHLGQPGTYPLAIDAISGGTLVGTTRTLLPWFPTGTPLTPLGVTLVWPITGVPNENANGLLTNDALPTSMADGGRLNALSTVASLNAGLSPVVDPFLLQFAQDNPNGYTTVDSSGRKKVVNDDPTMTQWLTSTQTAMGLNESALTAYGDVDAPALLDARQNPLVAQAFVWSNLVSTRVFAAPNTRPRVFIPQSGWVSTAQARAITHDGAAAVVVSTDSVPTVRQLNYTSSGRANYTSANQVTRYVLADASMSKAISHADTADPVALRQRLLGESLLIALELPSVHRTIAVSPFGLWSPTTTSANAVVAGLVNTRWTTPVTLADLIKQAPPTIRHAFLPVPADVTKEQVRPRQIASVVSASAPLADIKSVTAPLDPYRTTMVQTQFRAASQTWRPVRAAGELFASAYDDDVRAARDSLTVRVPRTVVIPGESGILPVTVVNDLPTSVTVGISVQANPSFRITIQDPGAISVESRRRHSLEVPITVYGSGSLDVNVQLTSADGRVVTAPLTVTVRSSAYSRVAAIVAGLAFLALLALSLASITRRIRNRGKDDS